MNGVAEKRFSKLALVSFILISLFFIYTISSSFFNFFNSTTPDGGLVIMKTLIFSAIYSLIFFLILFILNLVSLIICIKHPELKGKSFSIIGIILSAILIGYIIVAMFSSPI